MQLTSLQQDKVNEILALYNPQQQVICEFKAPTGSGKTLMASAFISHLISRNENDKFIFVIATPSSSSLPYFFEQKINKYKADLPYSKFEVEYIQSPSSARNDKTESIQKILPQQNKVYIFGKASFGRGRILSEYGIIDDFVKHTTERGYKLIYIRDEAHIGGEKSDNSAQAQNFETLMMNAAAFVLKMTATPNMQDLSTRKVILRERDLNNPLLNEGCYLLKTTSVPILDKSTDIKDALDEAIVLFKKIKKDYATLQIGINPAMLIQVANDSEINANRREEFEAALLDVKKKLNAAQLSWVQYFGDNNKDSDRVYKNNFTLDDITRNDNDIDVVIFKIGPSTGWDIPRACMLVQLRKVSSSNLNTQTIGRIKRNPYPQLQKHDVTDKYYVFLNTENPEKELHTYNYQIKEKFANETFLKIEITNALELKKELTANKAFQKAFHQYLLEKQNQIVQEINTYFIDKGTTYKRVLFMAANGVELTSNITNPFIFMREYKQLCSANKTLYNNIKATAQQFAKQINQQDEFLFTILLTKHKKDIRELIQRTRIFTPQFEIRESIYDPKEYNTVYSEQPITQNINREYLFDIQTDFDEPNQQPLDSQPEKIVYNKIYNLAENEKIKLRLWAKNQTTSNIFGDYLDDNNNIQKSYFDFIIKFSNGFYLYLEVKGKNDISPEKTALLEQAYESYFTGDHKNLFSPSLAIAVCRVDTDSRDIIVTPFYDEAEFTEPLKTKTFEELLIILSEKS